MSEPLSMGKWSCHRHDRLGFRGLDHLWTLRDFCALERAVSTDRSPPELQICSCIGLGIDRSDDFLRFRVCFLWV